MSKNWYILYVYAGQELKVSNLIKSELEKSKYKDFFGQIKVPIENVIQIRNGKKKQVEKTFLSGYVLIELELTSNKEQWFGLCGFLNRIKGVKKLVGFEVNQKPIPVSSDDIRHIFEKMGEIKSSNNASGISHMEGDVVRIIDGPFNNFNGVIEEINYEKSKVKVSVQIFGRSTPVDLDFSQIEEVI